MFNNKKSKREYYVLVLDACKPSEFYRAEDWDNAMDIAVSQIPECVDSSSRKLIRQTIQKSKEWQSLDSSLGVYIVTPSEPEVTFASSIPQANDDYVTPSSAYSIPQDDADYMTHEPMSQVHIFNRGYAW